MERMKEAAAEVGVDGERRLHLGRDEFIPQPVVVSRRARNIRGN
jgi:hypothetical protein